MRPPRKPGRYFPQANAWNCGFGKTPSIRFARRKIKIQNSLRNNLRFSEMQRCRHIDLNPSSCIRSPPMQSFQTLQTRATDCIRATIRKFSCTCPRLRSYVTHGGAHKVHCARGACASHAFPLARPGPRLSFNRYPTKRDEIQIVADRAHIDRCKPKVGADQRLPS